MNLLSYAFNNFIFQHSENCMNHWCEFHSFVIDKMDKKPFYQAKNDLLFNDNVLGK